ncbi:hypothetical protein B0H11DRAFT_2368335 [Mycena galericulata]|nr:hypothetical protein B0H11DRAFT_2368335 [Mycena galericulata]
MILPRGAVPLLMRSPNGKIASSPGGDVPRTRPAPPCRSRFDLIDWKSLALQDALREFTRIWIIHVNFYTTSNSSALYAIDKMAVPKLFDVPGPEAAPLDYIYKYSLRKFQAQPFDRDNGNKEADIQTHEAKKAALQRKCDAAEGEKREQEQRKGGKIAKLEETVTELDKILVKIRSQVDIKKKSIKDEEGRVAMCRAELAQTVKDKHTSLADKLATAEELLQSLLTDHWWRGYMAQLATARQQAAQAASSRTTSNWDERGRAEDAGSMVEGRRLRGRQWEKETGNDAGNGEGFRIKVARCSWSKEKEKPTMVACGNSRSKTGKGSSIACATRTSSTILVPTLTDKSSGGRLLSLDRENYGSAQALEIASSGKLYSVVVDDEKVGKEILNSRLEKKVHLIPLSMSPHSPPSISASQIRPRQRGLGHTCCRVPRHEQAQGISPAAHLPARYYCASAHEVNRETASGKSDNRHLAIKPYSSSALAAPIRKAQNSRSRVSHTYLSSGSMSRLLTRTRKTATNFDSPSKRVPSVSGGSPARPFARAHAHVGVPDAEAREEHDRQGELVVQHVRDRGRTTTKGGGRLGLDAFAHGRVVHLDRIGEVVREADGEEVALNRRRCAVRS